MRFILQNKFVNETFHIENDYIFQLNSFKYEIIPQYIIDECNKDINLIDIVEADIDLLDIVAPSICR
ncbi:MAG: hypothetical protein ACREVX_07920 [Clostridium sp.]|uniref:hypothetical protein n=1 Tax=Clostridium sp. TaxID=1506 RepID=UPI003D6D5595